MADHVGGEETAWDVLRLVEEKKCLLSASQEIFKVLFLIFLIILLFSRDLSCLLVLAPTPGCVQVRFNTYAASDFCFL